jgi:hypothetical protein
VCFGRVTHRKNAKGPKEDVVARPQSILYEMATHLLRSLANVINIYKQPRLQKQLGLWKEYRLNMLVVKH